MIVIFPFMLRLSKHSDLFSANVLVTENPLLL
jgi:hypothetical protein